MHDEDDLSDLFTGQDPALAGSSTGAGKVAELLEAVAAGDGIALLDDLLREGFSPQTIRAALTQGADKRKRPTLAATQVGQWRVLSCTASGFAAVGQQGRRPSAPSSSTLRHRMAPTNIRRVVEQQLTPTAAGHGVMVEAIAGGPLRSYCEERKGEAWSLIKGSGGAQDQQDASVVLGGVLPDLLVVESWHESVLPRRPKAWPSSSDPVASVDPQPAEWVVAVEVQLHAPWGAGVLAHKVRRATIAQRLGWFQATVWVIDSADIGERLRRAGVLAAPGHYFLNACDLGVGGDRVQLPEGAREPWWAKALR